MNEKQVVVNYTLQPDGTLKLDERPNLPPVKTADSCLYCGSQEDLDNDHVPPKCIFPKPRPTGLVEVRACRKCNGGASKDDEHFRMMLCLSQDIGETPEAQKNWAPIFRSLKRPQARGMMKALLGSIRPVRAMSWGGVHLGTRMGFKVDLTRINRVIERTVRGLYFKEMNQRLPEGYDVTVFCDETLINELPVILNKLQETLIIPLAAAPPKIIAPNIFFYRVLIAEDNPAATAWALTFYERKSFLAITCPRPLASHLQC